MSGSSLRARLSSGADIWDMKGIGLQQDMRGAGQVRQGPCSSINSRRTICSSVDNLDMSQVTPF